MSALTVVAEVHCAEEHSVIRMNRRKEVKRFGVYAKAAITAIATAPNDPARAVMPAAAAVTTVAGALVVAFAGVSADFVEVVMPVGADPLAVPAGGRVLTPVEAPRLGVPAGLEGVWPPVLCAGATGIVEAAE